MRGPEALDGEEVVRWGFEAGAGVKGVEVGVEGFLLWVLSVHYSGGWIFQMGAKRVMVAQPRTQRGCSGRLEGGRGQRKVSLGHRGMTDTDSPEEPTSLYPSRSGRIIINRKHSHNTAPASPSRVRSAPAPGRRAARRHARGGRGLRGGRARPRPGSAGCGGRSAWPRHRGRGPRLRKWKGSWRCSVG